MFYGEYSHNLDKKNRLIIPSRFREKIDELGVEKLFLTRGLDQCLFVFAESEWRPLENKFKSMPFTKREVRKFRRMFFSGAVEVSFDKQWRILIPDYLKEYADISREVMVIGVSNRIEIWDKQKWGTFYSASKETYEDISEKLIEF